MQVVFGRCDEGERLGVEGAELGEVIIYILSLATSFCVTRILNVLRRRKEGLTSCFGGPRDCQRTGSVEIARIASDK